jgi:trigger factor
MHITKKNLTPTKFELTLVADEELLAGVKAKVLAELARDLNIAGFRKGHAPAAMVEKSVDQNLLQSRFLDTALNELYGAGLRQEHIRPVASPEVNITKFVPFSTLEATAVVEAVGEIVLGDYKKIKVTKKTVPVTADEVTAVIEDLRTRAADKQEVKRAAKDGDEVTLDFSGKDAVTDDKIEGATASDYPLVLGSNSFIPGFEPELVGLKAGEAKTFDITFPKNYGQPALQGKKVTFDITVKAVKEVKRPKIDDAFAASVGPFKSVAELKADIKRQLQSEKEVQAQRELENDVLATLAEKSKAAVPKALVDEEIDRMEEEEKRNLVYRGQTWQEHLEAEGKTAERHHEDLRETAEARVKTGLVLAEAADAEGITVSPQELDERIALLKQQYPDKQMQADLDKPENRREIRSRLLTEKAINRLVSYATK